MDDSILYTKKDNIAWITMNQAEKRNRLKAEVMLKLVDTVRKAEHDNNVKVIIIKGAGDEAFCAGASIDEFEQDSVLENKNNLGAYAQICNVFNSLCKPSIAMINGYAMAGGCGLAMLPTFSIASDKAVFACPEINVGLWPMMVMAILFRTVGRKKGLELICTGDRIDAKEAERMGMITKVVPHSELYTYVSQLAGKLKAKSGSTMSLGLEASHNVADMEYEKAITYLRDVAVILSKTPDAIEGTKAFLEKRRAKWST